jgi:flagellar basal-body rod protein FlgG
MRALQTAATGMMAQELNVQVISNNIANLRTTGYKRQQAQFQDLLYENLKRPGSATSDQGNQMPAGLALGSGVKTVSTPRTMSQGSLTATEKTYDVAVRGEGYFKIRMPDGTAAYTRDGSFDLDSQGQLVTQNGYVVEPGITVPTNSTGVTISAGGIVQATIPGQAAQQNVGTIQLSRFINKTGLASIGDNLQQSYLEDANVNAVTEISSLIAAQRAYEMNSKVVTAADQMLSTIGQMFGR